MTRVTGVRYLPTLPYPGTERGTPAVLVGAGANLLLP